METRGSYSRVMPRLLPVGIASIFLLGTAFAGNDQPAPAPAPPPAAPKQDATPPPATAPQIDSELKAKLLAAFPAEKPEDVMAKFAALKLQGAELVEYEGQLDKWLAASKLDKEVPEPLRRWHVTQLNRMGFDAPAPKEPPKVDLNAGQQAAGKLEGATQQDGRQLNDGDNRTTTTPADAAVPRLPDQPGGSTNAGNAEEETRRHGSMAGKFVPTPGDKEKEKEGGPVVDEKFRSLLKMGTLGAMAGALVGIGLLPLFGPMGIFMGAMMGASMMVVTKKLSG